MTALIGQIVSQLYRMFCETCGRETDHTERDSGDWEIYTCKQCGAEHSYRVR